MCVCIIPLVQEEFRCLFISNVLVSKPDVVSHQRLGLLEGDVHRLPGRAVLAVSAAGAQGAGQDRHLDNEQASLHLLS